MAYTFQGQSIDDFLPEAETFMASHLSENGQASFRKLLDTATDYPDRENGQAAFRVLKRRMARILVRQVTWKCGHKSTVTAPDFDPKVDVKWCADHACPTCHRIAVNASLETH